MRHVSGCHGFFGPKTGTFAAALRSGVPQVITPVFILDMGELAESVDVSDIFFFFLLGEGEGRVRGGGRGGGVDF